MKIIKDLMKAAAGNKRRQLFVLIAFLFICTFSLTAQEQSQRGSSQSQRGSSQSQRGSPQNQAGSQESQAGSQESQTGSPQREEVIPNAQLALSSPDYLVTAGDIYTLSYSANGTPVTYRITVDSSYRVRISNLGVINAGGKTFRQLKNDAESIVSNNYPLSGVQLVLSQPGLFRVFINGEVHAATEISTWALARLSSLTRHMTAYASIRNVTVKSNNGQESNYDLFKAERAGDLSQNPYLRPDDIITFNRFERRVTIEGEVERPGTYQILDGEDLKNIVETYASGFTHLADKSRIELVRFTGSGSVSGNKIILNESDVGENYVLRNYDIITVPDITEARPVATAERMERQIILEGEVRRPGTYNLLPNENLRDLITVYGDGLTPLADPTRVNIVRYVNSDFSSGEKINVGQEEINNNYLLENYDAVFVPSIIQLRPVFFVEGALRNPDAEIGDPSASYRIVANYNAGEYFSTVVRAQRDMFTPESDTQNAYILRRGERIPINLNPILYDANFRNEIRIEENDTLIIPFRQYFVSVAGAVAAPGRYPYIPDRDYEYYISLAGGFVPNLNVAGAVNIRDINGKKLGKTDAITPETIITARANHPLYFFNQFAPILTTTLSIATTFISILLLTR